MGSRKSTRIQKRASEDPGTAGDQGEENWATLLREWLPQSFQVVTKGRIIGQDGRTSPQLDVLVLHSTYPRRLLDRKLYLAAGVAAAFECKVTLKSAHVAEALANCVATKTLYPARMGTPYRELHSPILFGLLAHSHAWKGEASNPVKNVDEKLILSDRSRVLHASHRLDVLCVADLATWASMTMVLGHVFPTNPPSGPASAYVGHYRDERERESESETFTPIGTLISSLTEKLAWERPELRSLADYYRLANLGGSGRGTMRQWPASMYSPEVCAGIQAGQVITGFHWSEWQAIYH